MEGDVIIIHDAAYEGALQTPLNAKIDLPRVQAKSDLKSSRDDRGYVIQTDKDLQQKFAQGPMKSEYKLIIPPGQTTQAEATLSIVPATLDRIELSVNNRVFQLQDKQVLTLSKSDQIAVRRLFTNVNQTKMSTTKSKPKTAVARKPDNF